MKERIFDGFSRHPQRDGNFHWAQAPGLRCACPGAIFGSPSGRKNEPASSMDAQAS